MASTIHTSLNRKRLVMGVGELIFGTEAGLILAFVLFEAYPLIPLIPLLHYLFRWIYRNDHFAIEGYMRYMKEADLYDPWVRPSITSARPKGHGRGLHC